jgi:hypothetical protein
VSLPFPPLPSVILVRVSLGPLHPEVFLAEVQVEIENLVVDGALGELALFWWPYLESESLSGSWFATKVPCHMFVNYVMTFLTSGALAHCAAANVLMKHHNQSIDINAIKMGHPYLT